MVITSADWHYDRETVLRECPQYSTNHKASKQISIKNKWIQKLTLVNPCHACMAFIRIKFSIVICIQYLKRPLTTLKDLRLAILIYIFSIYIEHLSSGHLCNEFKDYKPCPLPLEKRDLARQTSNSQWLFLFFSRAEINNRWHIMCDLKSLCNTVSAGERLLCPKSSHQVLRNNTTPLAAATWEQNHCTRCGKDIYAWARAHAPTQMHKHGMGQFRARRWPAVHLAKCWWPFLHSPSN